MHSEIAFARSTQGSYNSLGPKSFWHSDITNEVAAKSGAATPFEGAEPTLCCGMYLVQSNVKTQFSLKHSDKYRQSKIQVDGLDAQKRYTRDTAP